MKFFGKLLDNYGKDGTGKIEFDMSILTNRRIDAILIKLEDFKVQALMGPNIPALRAYFGLLHSLYSYLQSVEKWQKILLQEGRSGLNLSAKFDSVWAELEQLSIANEQGEGLRYDKYVRILHELIEIDETLKFAWQHLFSYFFRVQSGNTTLLDEAVNSLEEEVAEDLEDEKYIEEVEAEAEKQEEEQKEKQEKVVGSASDKPNN